MKGLCLNTSDSLAEICLIDGKIEDYTLVSAPHSEKLMPAVDCIMDKHSLSVADFDCLGVVVGPGSFTGVRIGVAVLKAMCVVNTNAKIVSITSFDLVAQNVSAFDFLVVLDSGNEDRFVARYKKNEIVEILAMKDDEINKYASQNSISVYANVVQQNKLTGVNAEFVEVKQESLSQIFQSKYAKNEFCPLNVLKPVYVKFSQAERQRSEKILSNLEIVTASDYDQLRRIENSCFGNEAWSENVFKEELMNNNKFYFVAKFIDEFIGYVGFEQTGDDLNIQKIAVLDDYRNCGVASKLINKVFEYRKKLDCNNILLEVNVNNKTAIEFYEKFGFKTISKRDRYYKNGDACLVMLKDKFDE